MTEYLTIALGVFIGLLLFCLFLFALALLAVVCDSVVLKLKEVRRGR